ncbi:MAG: sensor histidine kinase [Candidatus Methylomirabilia bacterium]
MAALIETLREKEQALAGAMERLMVVQEEERRLVAYDIHDCLAQVIVSAKQHLDTFEDLWQSQSPQALPELKRGLNGLDRAVLETRRLLAALRSGTLDSLGLIAALRDLVNETSQDTGWDAKLIDNLHGARLPSTVETAAYRIVQEALANAAKHTKASRVTGELGKENGHLVVEVNDSGVGFDPEGTPVSGLGLLSMRERARLLGGRCRVKSRRGLGTSVVATIPLRDGPGNGHSRQPEAKGDGRGRPSHGQGRDEEHARRRGWGLGGSGERGGSPGEIA